MLKGPPHISLGGSPVWSIRCGASGEICAEQFTSDYELIEDACGGASPHPQTIPPSNMQVLCEHLHLPKARQVEPKARVAAMVFAVNSTC